MRPKNSAPKFSISEVFKSFLIETKTIFFFELRLKFASSRTISLISTSFIENKLSNDIVRR